MDVNNVAYLTTAIISIVVAVVWFSRYKMSYWTRRGVEQLPDPHWLFGNFKDAILFRSAPGWHLKKHYHQCTEDAPFFGFYIFHKPCLQLRDPDLIKQIFVKDFDNFSDRYFSGCREKDSLGMRNLFGLRNPLWKNLRRKITPTLTLEKIRKMTPLMVESSRPMMEYIEELKTDSNGVKHIDTQELNSKYATDIIANVGFGTYINSFRNPNGEFTRRTKRFFCSMRRFIALVLVFFVPNVVDLLGALIYFDMSYINKYFWDAVKSREKTGTLRGDYIDSILKLRSGEQDPQYKLEGTNLLNQAGQFFSGVESSSIAASFTLMELARDKTIQDRAREDVQRAVARHGWTHEALSEMKYLEQCVLEAMRLYPPVPTLDRRARADYNIPGTDFVIEKGTGVYVSVSALHRDPKHFPNPDVFDPERFRSGSTRMAAYIPFGIGPRMCIGSRLALLHVKLAAARLLGQYALHRAPARAAPLHRCATFTLADDGIHIDFTQLASQ